MESIRFLSVLLLISFTLLSLMSLRHHVQHNGEDPLFELPLFQGASSKDHAIFFLIFAPYNNYAFLGSKNHVYHVVICWTSLHFISPWLSTTEWRNALKTQLNLLHHVWWNNCFFCPLYFEERLLGIILLNCIWEILRNISKQSKDMPPSTGMQKGMPILVDACALGQTPNFFALKRHKEQPTLVHFHSWNGFV